MICVDALGAATRCWNGVSAVCSFAQVRLGPGHASAKNVTSSAGCYQNEGGTAMRGLFPKDKCEKYEPEY